MCASENVKIHYEMKAFVHKRLLDDLTETCASALNSDSQIRAVDPSCWRTVCADMSLSCSCITNCWVSCIMALKRLIF